MKRWKTIAVILSGVVLVLWLPGKALAQDAGLGVADVLADVVTKLAVLVDGVLAYWVEGGTLTDPLGERLVGSLGQISTNTADFLAILVTLF